FTNAAAAADLEWLRTGLADMIATDLSQSRYVRPVPGERVLSVLQGAGLAQQARFDDKALEAVARATPAQSVLAGRFVERAGRPRVGLVRGRRGSGVAAAFRVEGGGADVLRLVDDIASRVKDVLDVPPETEKGGARPIAEVTTASLAAQRAYQQGL